MGLSAGQAERGGRKVNLSGWHWSGASAKDQIAHAIAADMPRICLISMNGKPMNELSTYPRDLPGLGLFMASKDGQMVEFGKIGTNEFLRVLQGKILDNHVQVFSEDPNSYLRYSFNFAEWKRLNVSPDGFFQIVNEPLLEGVNTVVFEAKNNLGGSSRQVMQIVLDKLGMQIAPYYPGYDQYVSESPSEISAILYNTDMVGGFNPDKITVNLRYGFDTLVPHTMTEVSTSRIAFAPNTPLTEGYYTAIINCEDNSGNKSQASWGFYVDQTPPTVEVLVNTLTPYSPLASNDLLIEYDIEDALSPLIQNTTIQIKQNGQILFTKAFPMVKAVGPAAYRWNYKTNSGLTVAQGESPLEIEPQD